MKAQPQTLLQALALIEPGSDFAQTPLTLARLYLSEGVPMPMELRIWLISYIDHERRKIRGAKSLQMANFAVDERREKAAERATGRRVAPKALREQFAEKMKIDEKTVRNWQKDPRFQATVIVSEYLMAALADWAIARIDARNPAGPSPDLAATIKAWQDEWGKK